MRDNRKPYETFCQRLTQWPFWLVMAVIIAISVAVGIIIGLAVDPALGGAVAGGPIALVAVRAA